MTLQEQMIKLAEDMMRLALSLGANTPITFMGKPLSPADEAWRALLAEKDAEKQANESAFPAPYGRDGYGLPLPHPYYEKAKALWNHAQMAVDGRGLPKFNSLDPAYKNNPEAFGVAVEALANSPWGKYWLSEDVNAIMIDRDLQMKWNGYFVRQVADARGDTTYVRDNTL